MSDSHLDNAVFPGADANIDEHLSIDRLAARAEQPTPQLVMRELSAAGDFVRAVNCEASAITIVRGRRVDRVEPFRQALLGRPHSVAVNLRYGTRALHSSEVRALAAPRHLWVESTVVDVLRAAGAAEPVVKPTLERAGLWSVKDERPQTLGECALRRLAIACLIHTKAKVLYFDRPFQGISSSFVDQLASLLLEAAEGSEQIFVVTGLSRVPMPWRNSETVGFSDLDDVRPRKISFNTSNILMEEVISNVRDMMRNNRVRDENRGYFVTRPQMIHPPVRGAAIPEALQNEAIANPTVGNVARNAMRAGLNRSRVDAVEESMQTRPPRQRKDSLTSVTATHRLRRDSEVYKAIRSLRKAAKRAITDEE